MSAATLVYRYLLLGLPAIFLATSAARLYTFYHERSDIWWTPRGMSVPLEAGHHRVMVYVRGKELDDVVAKRQLLLQDESGTSVVTRTDVGLRFNNWDRVRAERIPPLLMSAATVGAASALLLVGLVLTLAGRRPGLGRA
jgi:hypothetical protein